MRFVQYVYDGGYGRIGKVNFGSQGFKNREVFVVVVLVNNYVDCQMVSFFGVGLIVIFMVVFLFCFQCWYDFRGIFKIRLEGEI